MALGRRRPAVIEADDHVTGVGEGAIEQVPAAPRVGHRLRRGLAVDEDNHRVFLRCIEDGGTHHPAVERDTVGNANLQELRLLPDDTGDLTLDHRRIQQLA